MRILHIDTEQSWRGGENQLRLLLIGLNQTAVDSAVAVRPGSAAAQRLAGLTEVVPTPMRGGFNPRAAYALSRYCRSHQVDLIDAHTANAHALGLLIKGLYPRVRLVVHRRVDYAPSAGWFSRRKYLSAKVDRYVAISQAIAEVLVAYGVPRARISVVRSAVPIDRYQNIDRTSAKAALAMAYGIDPQLTFIGNASALTAQKGHETLLHAAALLKAEGKAFHVFIAGDGDLTPALEQLRIKLGLEHCVTFLGFIEDVATFLSGLDILAVPSNFEGLGTILLDGIGAGLAVAATNVGGIPEVIIDGTTGSLSEVGDARGHADVLARLIDDPQLRRELNAAGKRHIEAEFSVGAMVGGNLEVYREVVER